MEVTPDQSEIATFAVRSAYASATRPNVLRAKQALGTFLRDQASAQGKPPRCWNFTFPIYRDDDRTIVGVLFADDEFRIFAKMAWSEP